MEILEEFQMGTAMDDPTADFEKVTGNTGLVALSQSLHSKNNLHIIDPPSFYHPRYTIIEFLPSPRASLSEKVEIPQKPTTPRRPCVRSAAQNFISSFFRGIHVKPPHYHLVFSNTEFSSQVPGLAAAAWI